MKGGTLFSGIGTPELAASWIDWRWCAEIDPFASAVLAQRFPNTPNLGDVTEIDPDAVEPVDIIVFGSPCQSFSVAGKRLGLDDPRGNMALVGLRLVSRIQPRWLVFENVPGLLSNWSGAEDDPAEAGVEWESTENSDLAAFLGAVRECGYLGCWRSLDAQFAGLAQRRERLFFVGHLGDWRPSAAVLFEPESLCGHPPPRREAGQRVGPTLKSRATAGGAGWGTDFLADGGMAVGVDARNNVETGDLSITVQGGGDCKRGHSLNTIPLAVTHSLRADGFDASEDGTGRATPLVVGALPAMDTPKGHGFADFRCNQSVDAGHIIPIQSVQAVRDKKQNGLGVGGDSMFTLTGRDQHAVAFTERSRTKDRNLEMQEELAYALDNPGEGGRAQTRLIAYDIMGVPATRGSKETDIHTPLHARTPGSSEASTGTVVAFQSRIARNGRGQPEEIAPALNGVDAGETSDMRPLVASSMMVRRLTPRECERLQGFPDDFTLVRYNGKPAADGPRYRALGNAMARPVIAWVLQRIRDSCI